MNKILYGVAVNDADYRVRITENYYKPCGKRSNKDIWVCPFYAAWKNMLGRVYGNQKRKAYEGVGICDSWLLFSNFKRWMETQPWEGNSLDKDLIGSGKLYSEDTCIFIPHEVNSFLIDQKKRKHKGVSFHKRINKWQANVNNPFSGKLESLGYYDTEDLASAAYYRRKVELAKDLSKVYLETRPDISKALLLKFSKGGSSE